MQGRSLRSNGNERRQKLAGSLAVCAPRDDSLTTGSLCCARISLIPSPQRDYRRKDREIEHHVPRKRQLIAHVTEATAADIDPARLCRDACTDEDEHEREQERKSTGIQTPKDQRKPANHFQPGK